MASLNWADGTPAWAATSYQLIADLHRPLVRRLVARGGRARCHVAQRQGGLGHAVVARLHQPALRRGDVALDADAFAQRQPVAQAGQHMALLRSAPIEIGGAHRIGRDLLGAFVHGAAERVERLRIAARRRLLEPRPGVDEIARHAEAAQIENAEIDLRPRVSGRRGLLEQVERARLVARRAGKALCVDDGQAMRALARAGVGGALDVAQAIAIGAAIEQHGAEPRLGIGIARHQRSERRLRRAEIAGAIGGDGRAQRRRHVGRVLLRERGTADGNRRRKHRHPQHRHFVLKV